MERPDEILHAFKSDRREGFRLLYDAYYEILLLYASGITADAGAAEDAVQECFITFWTRDHLLKLTGGLEGYLFRAVKYASLNQVRNARRRQQLHDAAGREEEQMAAARDERGEERADDEARDGDDAAPLFAAINRLPGERRKIFLMICVDGLSYKETAGKLNISINTVKTQMSRAVKFLREHLKERLFSILVAWIARGNGGGVA
ncbi:MAG: sigma-70 family RNA polymerase sigma factor [Odoribacteraceae bacterium]|jgi:RNA polymerase sigma-70 factor (ECF subfamily)|nr:sigma-70 family RNA polymerase sigma factor [Odoribacteraceae bacterium]